MNLFSVAKKDGHTETFTTPNEELNEILKLPVGEYRLQDIRLRSGYTCNNLQSPTINWITVTENEPVTLKAGAPLKQMVKIERQGPVLKLKYNLFGVGGETYAITRAARPAFTVFKGDKKLADGDFEFG